MTASNPILDDLEREWDRAASWFHVHHQPRPYDEHQQPHQEEHMPDTAALKDAHAALTGALQNAGASLAEALDNHAAHLGALITDVEAVTGHPLVQAALAALHVDPAVLAGFTAGLNALAAATPRPNPEPQPA